MTRDLHTDTVSLSKSNLISLIGIGVVLIGFLIEGRAQMSAQEATLQSLIKAVESLDRRVGH